MPAMPDKHYGLHYALAAQSQPVIQAIYPVLVLVRAEYEQLYDYIKTEVSEMRAKSWHRYSVNV
eukprot:scaffold65433_cov23-Prasinocladus_malaysianus.AAC.1